MLYDISIELAIVMQIKICKHSTLINKVCKLHILQYMILVDLIFGYIIYLWMCACANTQYCTYDSNSVIQRRFSHLPLGRMAAVHPERLPSDMTSSAL